LVDIDDASDSPHHFKFVLSPGPTMATAFVSLVEGPKEIGTMREVCATGIGYAEKIGEVLNNQGGAALIMDYGNDYPMGFTLQGIFHHRFTESPLEKPGEVDLSTFVDFSSLKKAVERFKSVKSFGPQYQCDFLHQLGMDARFAKLIQNPKLTDQQVQSLIGAYERLTHPTEMGHHYKAMVMANLPKQLTPTGFDLKIIPAKEDTPNIKSKRVATPQTESKPVDTTNTIKEGETSPLRKKTTEGTDKPNPFKNDIGIFL